MKIHFIVEIEDVPGKPRRCTVERLTPIAPANGDHLKTVLHHTTAADVAAAAPKRRGRPPKASVFPIVKEAAPTPPPVRAELSTAPGPVFDPAFVGIIKDLPEPFTRRAIAAATGLELNNVTLRLNRMKHHGWIENPAPGLWRKTRTFGEK
ncbi:MAG: hypothetical protein NTZ16_12555 [Verrucomicrobia bacterium]|nr:hypothetical protein [Verrucomicrobiota bacterium]